MTTTETVKFQVGESYYDRSACDWDCIFRFEIVRRTEKSVWIRDRHDDSKVVRRAIRVYDGVESFSPFGSYSMSAVVTAERNVSELNED